MFDESQLQSIEAAPISAHWFEDEVKGFRTGWWHAPRLTLARQINYFLFPLTSSMQMIKRSRRSSRKSIMQSSELISTGWIVNANSAPLEIKFLPPFRFPLDTPKVKHQSTDDGESSHSNRNRSDERQTAHIKGHSDESRRRWGGKIARLSWQILGEAIKIGRQFEVRWLLPNRLVFFFILWPIETCLYLTRYGAADKLRTRSLSSWVRATRKLAKWMAR